MSREHLEIVYLLADSAGYTPRRCHVLRQVRVDHWAYQGECWIVEAYPPLCGRDEPLLLHLPDKTRSLWVDHLLGETGVDILLMNCSPELEVFDPRDLVKLDLGGLVSPDQVSRRAYPYPCDDPLLP